MKDVERWYVRIVHEKTVKTLSFLPKTGCSNYLCWTIFNFVLHIFSLICSLYKLHFPTPHEYQHSKSTEVHSQICKLCVVSSVTVVFKNFKKSIFYLLIFVCVYFCCCCSRYLKKKSRLVSGKFKEKDCVMHFCLLSMQTQLEGNL